MNTKHTPSPWKVCSTYAQAQKGHGYIAAWSDQELPIATVKPLHLDPEESRANMDFIVRACNRHDELVAALESCESILSAIECGQDKPMATGQILDVARAALAKARGE